MNMDPNFFQILFLVSRQPPFHPPRHLPPTSQSYKALNAFICLIEGLVGFRLRVHTVRACVAYIRSVYPFRICHRQLPLLCGSLT